MADGSLIVRERGTPQGGVISPLLANLFLHYTFDLWMTPEPFRQSRSSAMPTMVCHERTDARGAELRERWR